MPRQRLRPVPALAVAVVTLAGAAVVARSAFGAGPSTFPPVARVPPSAPAAAQKPSPPAAWVTTTHDISSGGLTRSYLVAEPSPAPTGPVPVVVVLHGSAVTPAFEEKRTGFVPVVGSAIVVYPTGYDESWNAGSCCGGAHGAGVDDEAFITAVVAQVLAQHPEAAPSKVDLVGYSNGGRLAWALACDDPRLFRAIAVYGAVLDKSCGNLGPISGMEIAGMSDPEVTIDASEPPTVSFGFTEPTVTEQTEELVASDGCRAPAVTTSAGEAVTHTWSNCAAGRQVALTLYAGQDHTWPAGSGTTPSAEMLIWRFFTAIGAT